MAGNKTDHIKEESRQQLAALAECTADIRSAASLLTNQADRPNHPYYTLAKALTATADALEYFQKAQKQHGLTRRLAQILDIESDHAETICHGGNLLPYLHLNQDRGADLILATAAYQIREHIGGRDELAARVDEAAKEIAAFLESEIGKDFNALHSSERHQG